MNKLNLQFTVIPKIISLFKRIHTSPEEAESQISQAVHVENNFVIGQPSAKRCVVISRSLILNHR